MTIGIPCRRIGIACSFSGSVLPSAMAVVERRTFIQLLSLLYRASPPLFVSGILLFVLTSAAPAAVAVCTAELVRSTGMVVLATDAGRVLRAMAPGLAGLVSLFTLQQVMWPIVNVVIAGLGSKLALLLREKIMEAALAPEGVEHLEDPATSDAISLAAGIEGRAFAPEEMVSALFSMCSARLQGILSAFLLFPYGPWIPFLLIASWSLEPRWVNGQTRIQVSRTESVTPALRESDYYKELILRPAAAKEMRIFGLGAWAADRSLKMRWEGLRALLKERGRTRWHFLLYLSAPTAASALVLFLLAQSAAQGTIDAGRLTMYILALIGAKETGRSMAWWTRSLYGAGSIGHVVGLAARTRSVSTVSAAPSGGLPAEAMPRQSIRFASVGFAYPGSSAPVFPALDLTIHAGRSLAVVGRNGAGKTTLVKLLARLYDPQAGRILVDGNDLRSLNPGSWRSRLAVIFQDFVHYELPARDNVGFGRLGLLDDGEALQSAADRAGASTVIESLPRGWDTVLSRGAQDAAELSGGQWQKIALARALMAVEGGAGILILDEPTANLDVQAEAELFERFLELTRGLTTLLISHRMSSVRHADEICVIDGGAVVERGSHEALMAASGVYAGLFRLQAGRFTEGD